MTENNTEKKNRAVLVGLSSRALAPEENADEASMEELSALQMCIRDRNWQTFNPLVLDFLLDGAQTP